MLKKVKSKHIIKVIFNNIIIKRKLKIIKYNEKIKERLNITEENFNRYETLKEFNKKYNSNIEDIDIKDLNLYNKKIGNEGLKDLIKIKFNEINELDLRKNNITDINDLEKFNLKN